ncbi:uncharacterized protein MONBRDRAFT_28503 [Monosiga brevicollis MX1]|uniref:Uncharacterized protein n=1 Tax=Monosiga brevicollis TaxID=81824 RepID=A9V8C7_MONBE|nr:uncharacterized protein MONBRDRAFT_28503 [Monosiga brevicollis MX1]EDQ86315.1 predicted protein [Monosiga brevicollis MX1]|eukprot:XP_001748985.1 hypothetical protein [Monosiga brevicollis MX1]
MTALVREPAVAVAVAAASQMQPDEEAWASHEPVDPEWLPSDTASDGTHSVHTPPSSAASGSTIRLTGGALNSSNQEPNMMVYEPTEPLPMATSQRGAPSPTFVARHGAPSSPGPEPASVAIKPRAQRHIRDERAAVRKRAILDEQSVGHPLPPPGTIRHYRRASGSHPKSRPAPNQPSRSRRKIATTSNSASSQDTPNSAAGTHRAQRITPFSWRLHASASDKPRSAKPSRPNASTERRSNPPATLPLPASKGPDVLDKSSRSASPPPRQPISNLDPELLARRLEHRTPTRSRWGGSLADNAHSASTHHRAGRAVPWEERPEHTAVVDFMRRKRQQRKAQTAAQREAHREAEQARKEALNRLDELRRAQREAPALQIWTHEAEDGAEDEDEAVASDIDAGDGHRHSSADYEATDRVSSLRSTTADSHGHLAGGIDPALAGRVPMGLQSRARLAAAANAMSPATFLPDASPAGQPDDLAPAMLQPWALASGPRPTTADSLMLDATEHFDLSSSLNPAARRSQPSTMPLPHQTAGEPEHVLTELLRLHDRVQELPSPDARQPNRQRLRELLGALHSVATDLFEPLARESADSHSVPHQPDELATNSVRTRQEELAAAAEREIEDLIMATTLELNNASPAAGTHPDARPALPGELDLRSHLASVEAQEAAEQQRQQAARQRLTRPTREPSSDPLTPRLNQPEQANPSPQASWRIDLDAPPARRPASPANHTIQPRAALAVPAQPAPTSHHGEEPGLLELLLRRYGVQDNGMQTQAVATPTRVDTAVQAPGSTDQACQTSTVVAAALPDHEELVAAGLVAGRLATDQEPHTHAEPTQPFATTESNLYRSDAIPPAGSGSAAASRSDSPLLQDEDGNSVEHRGSPSPSPSPNPERDASPIQRSTPREPEEDVRLAPDDLHRQLLGELNLLLTIDESLQQLGVTSESMALSHAQQETVALAQLLQARQAEITAIKLEAEEHQQRVVAAAEERVQAASAIASSEAVARVRADQRRDRQEAQAQLDTTVQLATNVLQTMQQQPAALLDTQRQLAEPVLAEIRGTQRSQRELIEAVRGLVDAMHATATAAPPTAAVANHAPAFSERAAQPSAVGYSEDFENTGTSLTLEDLSDLAGPPVPQPGPHSEPHTDIQTDRSSPMPVSDGPQLNSFQGTSTPVETGSAFDVPSEAPSVVSSIPSATADVPSAIPTASMPVSSAIQVQTSARRSLPAPTASVATAADVSDSFAASGSTDKSVPDDLVDSKPATKPKPRTLPPDLSNDAESPAALPDGPQVPSFARFEEDSRRHAERSVQAEDESLRLQLEILQGQEAVSLQRIEERLTRVRALLGSSSQGVGRSMLERRLQALTLEHDQARAYFRAQRQGMDAECMQRKLGIWRRHEDAIRDYYRYLRGQEQDLDLGAPEDSAPYSDLHQAPMHSKSSAMPVAKPQHHQAQPLAQSLPAHATRDPVSDLSMGEASDVEPTALQTLPSTVEAVERAASTYLQRRQAALQAKREQLQSLQVQQAEYVRMRAQLDEEERELAQLAQEAILLHRQRYRVNQSTPSRHKTTTVPKQSAELPSASLGYSDDFEPSASIGDASDGFRNGSFVASFEGSAPATDVPSFEGSAPATDVPSFEGSAPATDVPSFEGSAPATDVPSFEGSAPATDVPSFEGSAPATDVPSFEGSAPATDVPSFEGSAPATDVPSFEGSAPATDVPSFEGSAPATDVPSFEGSASAMDVMETNAPSVIDSFAPDRSAPSSFNGGSTSKTAERAAGEAYSDSFESFHPSTAHSTPSRPPPSAQMLATVVEADISLGTDTEEGHLQEEIALLQEQIRSRQQELRQRVHAQRKAQLTHQRSQLQAELDALEHKLQDVASAPVPEPTSHQASRLPKDDLQEAFEEADEYSEDFESNHEPTFVDTAPQSIAEASSPRASVPRASQRPSVVDEELSDFDAGSSLADERPQGAVAAASTTAGALATETAYLDEDFEDDDEEVSDAVNYPGAAVEGLDLVSSFEASPAGEVTDASIASIPDEAELPVSDVVSTRASDAVALASSGKDGYSEDAFEEESSVASTLSEPNAGGEVLSVTLPAASLEPRLATGSEELENQKTLVASESADEVEVSSVRSLSGLAALSDPRESDDSFTSVQRQAEVVASQWVSDLVEDAIYDMLDLVPLELAEGEEASPLDEPASSPSSTTPTPTPPPVVAVEDAFTSPRRAGGTPTSPTAERVQRLQEERAVLSPPVTPDTASMATLDNSGSDAFLVHTVTQMAHDFVAAGCPWDNLPLDLPTSRGYRRLSSEQLQLCVDLLNEILLSLRLDLGHSYAPRQVTWRNLLSEEDMLINEMATTFVEHELAEAMHAMAGDLDLLAI